MAEYLCGMCGGKVRKIPVNAALGCPNRDGTLGREGCIYCNNAAFNPSYAFRSAQKSIKEQVEEGILFNSKKEKVAGYLAYFQAYSNTYGKTEHLIKIYEEALSCDGVLGLVIATRPDCLASDLLDWMEKRFGRLAPKDHPFLLVELGIESTLDRTLKATHRGHDWACAKNAIKELDRRGIVIGAHIILGLPGEGLEDYRHHIQELSELPVKTIKFHQLQVIKGTTLEKMYAENPSCIHLFSAEEYATTLKSLIKELREDIVLDRLVSETPPDLLVAPRWGLKPDEFAKKFSL